MPTSAAGIWTNSARQSGFTLLEVMVTVVLIGIIATFAVLSIPGGGPSDRLEREGQRLLVLLDRARQEAVLRSQVRGVYFTPSRYAFMVWGDNGGWSTPQDAGPQQFSLPEGFDLQLWVEGRAVDFTRADDGLPQVLLIGSGEATPFTLILSALDEKSFTKTRYRVSVDLVGRLAGEPVK